MASSSSGKSHRETSRRFLAKVGVAACVAVALTVVAITCALIISINSRDDVEVVVGTWRASGKVLFVAEWGKWDMRWYNNGHETERVGGDWARRSDGSYTLDGMHVSSHEAVSYVATIMSRSTLDIGGEIYRKDE